MDQGTGQKGRLEEGGKKRLVGCESDRNGGHERGKEAGGAFCFMGKRGSVEPPGVWGGKSRGTCKLWGNEWGQRVVEYFRKRVK